MNVHNTLKIIVIFCRIEEKDRGRRSVDGWRKKVLFPYREEKSKREGKIDHRKFYLRHEKGRAQSYLTRQSWNVISETPIGDGNHLAGRLFIDCYIQQKPFNNR